MIGHGVSSRSSHSAAAGRTTVAANSWTQSLTWITSSDSSRENDTTPPLPANTQQRLHEHFRERREAPTSAELPRHTVAPLIIRTFEHGESADDQRRDRVARQFATTGFLAPLKDQRI